MDHATLKERTIEQQLRRQQEYEVTRFGDEITVDGLKFVLLDDFKEAFSNEGLALRYTPLLKQYDYIVGDLSAGQLRLRGFYHEEREVSADQKINTLADYLYETVNFGAPYFILKNESVAFRPVKIRDYLSEWEHEHRKKASQGKPKAKNQKAKNGKNSAKSSEETRPKQKRTGKKPINGQQNQQKKRRHRFTEKKREGQPDASSKMVKNVSAKQTAKPKRQGSQSTSKKKRTGQQQKSAAKSTDKRKKTARSFTIKERG